VPIVSIVIGYPRSLDSRMASTISSLLTPLLRPATSKGERRGRYGRGTIAYVSPFRRLMTTSSVLDSSSVVNIRSGYSVEVTGTARRYRAASG
jgi:hypothetical protein